MPFLTSVHSPLIFSMIDLSSSVMMSNAALKKSAIPVLTLSHSPEMLSTTVSQSGRSMPKSARSMFVTESQIPATAFVKLVSSSFATPIQSIFVITVPIVLNSCHMPSMKMGMLSTMASTRSMTKSPATGTISGNRSVRNSGILVRIPGIFVRMFPIIGSRFPTRNVLTAPSKSFSGFQIFLPRARFASRFEAAAFIAPKDPEKVSDASCAATFASPSSSCITCIAS